ncbi:MAG TPA: ABC transporter permease [Candidatus Binatia bacterium]|jgi:NitT/TauT family transport system permease protein|nr:ABC transporter permease [Candidatus Binatia bacterium]
MSLSRTEEQSANAPASFAYQELAAEQQAARQKARAVQRRWTTAQIAIRIISLLIVLSAWEYLGRHINPVLFTYPTAVGSAAVKMIASGELWKYLSQSLIVLFAGLGLATIFGIALGLIMARFWVVDVALDTYITALYSIPSVALVPVLVLWFGFEITAKIAVVFLFTFFPIVINTHQGVKNVDNRLTEVGRAFRCSERQLWIHIVLPAAVPYIVTGLRLAIGRGLIGMVLADLYTAITGIGYLISRYASIYRTDAMFVPIATLGLLGITLTGLLRFVEKRVAPWMHQPDQE